MPATKRMLWIRRLPPEERRAMVQRLRSICPDCGGAIFQAHALSCDECASRG